MEQSKRLIWFGAWVVVFVWCLQGQAQAGFLSGSAAAPTVSMPASWSGMLLGQGLSLGGLTLPGTGVDRGDISHGYSQVAKPQETPVWVFIVAGFEGALVLIALLGNLYALGSGKGQIGWGKMALILAGIIAGFALVALIVTQVEAGAAPATPAPATPSEPLPGVLGVGVGTGIALAVLVGLGLTNFLLGQAAAAKKSKPKAPKISLIPWFSQPDATTFQAGLSLCGRF